MKEHCEFSESDPKSHVAVKSLSFNIKIFNFLLRRNWRKAGWWGFCCTWIMSHSISDIQACAKVQMECLGGSKGRCDPPVPWLDGECWLTRSFELQRNLQALRCNFSQHYWQCSRAEDRHRILGLNLSWKTRWMLPEADFLPVLSTFLLLSSIMLSICWVPFYVRVGHMLNKSSRNGFPSTRKCSAVANWQVD